MSLYHFRPWHFDEIQTVMNAKAVAREANTQARRRDVLAKLADYEKKIGI
jgi:hypothetical protein